MSAGCTFVHALHGRIGSNPLRMLRLLAKGELSVERGDWERDSERNHAACWNFMKNP